MCPYKNAQNVNEHLYILKPKPYSSFKTVKTKEKYFLLLGLKFRSKNTRQKRVKSRI